MSEQAATPVDQGLVVDARAFDAAMFDLDGVVTRTATLHATTWRQLFDDFLRRRAETKGEVFRPFDVERDYRTYVDGKPRHDGIRSFLASRRVTLPEGKPDDPADRETVFGLGARKNQLFREALALSGVEVFESSVELIRELREAGLKTAAVTSSKNAAAVIAAAGLADLFDACVDGVEAERQGLKGKPAPDIFMYAARLLGVDAKRAMGVEDALAGVEAIRAAGYGLVVGVDRAGQAAALRQHGATLVVRDLRELRIVPAPPVAPMGLPAAPSPAAEWLLVEEGFTLTREHELESIFAIGNGHLGSRGSLAEGSGMSAPATFVAGAFDAQPGPTPGLAMLPDWARLSLTIEGQPLRLDTGRTLEHRRMLDMRQGILWREWRHEDAAGRITRLRGLRLASLADRRLLIQSVAVSPENYSGTASLEVPLDETVTHRLSGGGVIALATASALREIGDRSTASGRAPKPPLVLELELGETYRLDRVVAVRTSRDQDQPEAAARSHAGRAINAGLPALISAHREAWRVRWDASDICIEGDPAAQRALRFAVYHLLSAVDPDDDRVSIGARALTGAAYNGHVFWDTEIFMLPFYVLTWPEAARALLTYRHRTLPAARGKAARHGERGAFYAWESADTGQDVTPPFVVAPNGEVVPILLADQEQHISADVAYGVWTYWRATGDERFLLDAGAEILLETARFWAGRARMEGDGRRHIRGVVGPDEYHETVDDDAYTNGMAQWNLEVGEAVARLLGERWPERWRALSSALGLDLDEALSWAAAAQEIHTGFDARTGLFEQFEGYFALEDIDLTAFEPRNAPMDVLLGRDRIRGSKIIKQPDVVMLLHLLWDRFPPEVRTANFRYYEPRCAHGSSLSPAIHAAVAARLGDVALAERYFRQASEIDLSDNMGNAAGGVHAAALGGLWQAAVFGFAGLRPSDEAPVCEPNLPPHWRELSFRLKWRGRTHEFKLPTDRAPAGSGTQERGS
jgi:beta-phosphoglucomutase family hydrolase